MYIDLHKFVVLKKLSITHKLHYLQLRALFILKCSICLGIVIVAVSQQLNLTFSV